MRRHTRRLLGFPLLFLRWRHMAIALDRRVLQGIGCRAYGVPCGWPKRGSREDEDDTDNDDIDGLGGEGAEEGGGHAAVSHAQASHSARVGNAVYGNDLNLISGMTDQLMASYRLVSQRWHRFAGLDQLSTGSRHKRGLSHALQAMGGQSPRKKRPEAGSMLRIRRRLWNRPAMQDCMRTLLGPEAKPRSVVQRDALRLMTRSRPESIIIMPTGSGKTLLFVLPTLLPQAQVTVVITLLVALRQDLVRRCKEWNISFACFSHGWAFHQPHAAPLLILVDVESASSVSFLTLMQGLHRLGRLDRIVFR